MSIRTLPLLDSNAYTGKSAVLFFKEDASSETVGTHRGIIDISIAPDAGWQVQFHSFDRGVGTFSFELSTEEFESLFWHPQKRCFYLPVDRSRLPVSAPVEHLPVPEALRELLLNPFESDWQEGSTLSPA